jgi:hypothetical protein
MMLPQAILGFITHYDQTAKPLKWSYTVEQLERKLGTHLWLGVLEEIAYYLGHVTLRGMPAVQTTVRHTQMTRAQVREKLKVLKG